MTFGMVILEMDNDSVMHGLRSVVWLEKCTDVLLREISLEQLQRKNEESAGASGSVLSWKEAQASSRWAPLPGIPILNTYSRAVLTIEG